MLNLPEMPTHNWDRIREAIAEAVDELSPADRDARIAWCIENDEHGTSVAVDEDGVMRFEWGGAPLMKMHRDAFLVYGATRAEMS